MGLDYFSPQNQEQNPQSNLTGEHFKWDVTQIKPFFNPLNVLSLGTLFKSYVVGGPVSPFWGSVLKQPDELGLKKSRYGENVAVKNNNVRLSIHGIKSNFSEEAYVLLSGVDNIYKNRLEVDKSSPHRELLRAVSYENRSRRAQLSRLHALEHLFWGRNVRRAGLSQNRIKITQTHPTFEFRRSLRRIKIRGGSFWGVTKEVGMETGDGLTKSSPLGVLTVVDTKILNPRHREDATRTLTLLGVSQKPKPIGLPDLGM